MTPDQARALYRASKKRTIRKQAVVAVQRAKADTRARAMIERWQNGETHSQIAEALGVTRCCVTRAISRYRTRHPDCCAPSPGAAGLADPLTGKPTTSFVPSPFHEVAYTHDGSRDHGA